MSVRTAFAWTIFTASFIAAAATAFTALAADEGEVVAYWTFDQGDGFLVDSSGKGNDLEQNGTVTSITTAKVGDGSAQFTAAGVLGTIEAFDLSPYKEVTLSWYMQLGNTNPSILWELTPAYTGFPGAFVCATRSSTVPEGNGYVSQEYTGAGYEEGYALDYFPTSVTTEWKQYSAHINLEAAEKSGRVEIYQDGVLISTDQWLGDDPDPPLSFPGTEKFFIGARFGKVIPYTGLIDDFKIEGVFKEFTPGDASRDGMVNEDDAALMAQNWLKSSEATWSNGDFNKDGAVNDIDATMMAANWYYGVPAETAVPEPCAFALLAGAVAAGLVCRAGIRRRQS